MSGNRGAGAAGRTGGAPVGAGGGSGHNEGGDPWATWRPMGVGRRAARTIRNPVIEPLWEGRRVLARLAAGAVELRDEQGLPLAGHPQIQAALLAVAGGAAMVLDGYLVDLPGLDAPTTPAGPDMVEAPSLGETSRQFMLGRRGRGPGSGSGSMGLGGRGPGSRGGGVGAGSAGSVRRPAFVAVDLLRIDDEELIDVPLLERRRLLDSVVVAGEVVRRSPHARPPAEAWYRQWRAFGFREVAVKEANGRYRPGVAADDWARSPIQQP
jgi:hypothetical protein